ncbi:hypothetical protein BGZ96_002104 [Linnemannia gamsii]|uniref:F-box domain-containing protein n=1 Tax=Linnemannia gamsii TaxID=64522 RepID=A0ABQ7JL47_9FUNG|nr:hypothetical protein BGZ96_002104 [Linnemannia gamsii]
MSSIHPALDIPEILTHLGSFLSPKDACICVLVSKAWCHAFQPVLWEHVETANNISPQVVEKHAHHIRTLSLADTHGLKDVLLRCTRLRTLVLWPDALEDEDDDEDDDFSDGYDSSDDEEEAQLLGSHALSTLFGNEYSFKSWTRTEGQRGPLSCSGSSIDGGGGSDSECEWARNQDRKEQNAAVGAWEWDKVRRDSGVGEETTAAHAQDTEVALLQIADFAQPHVHYALHHQLPSHSQQQHSHYRYQNYHQQHQHEKQEQMQKQPPILAQEKKSLLADLLLRNPGLIHVEVYVERKSPGGSFWRALAVTEPKSPSPATTIGHWSLGSVMSPKTHPRLLTFQSLLNLHVHQHIKPFLQMCTRLESLDLDGCTIRQLYDEYYKGLQFPRLKHVKFGRIKEWSLWSQLLFIRQCHELQTLNWRVPRLGFPVQGFCDALETNWQNLVSLTLPESRLSDGDLAKILTAAAPLTTLSIRRSDFGEYSFRALRRHFRTLQQLDLFQCPDLSSDMTQHILESCPLLESFEGNKLLLSDVAQGLGGGRRRGWACHNLRVLDVHLAGHSSAIMVNHQDVTVSVQWMVYSQLAKMDNLVHLSIGGKSTHPHPHPHPHGVDAAVPPTMVVPPAPPLHYPTTPALATTLSFPPSASYTSLRSHTEQSERPSVQTSRRRIDGLHMSLDDGLSQLSTLKNLRFLRFTGLAQEMEEDDVWWMIEQWPELKVIQGKLHSNERRQDVLESLLASYGISAWTNFNQPPLRQPQLQHPHPPVEHPLQMH